MDTSTESTAPAMVRAESLTGFAELVRSRGHDPNPLIEAARIDPADIHRRDHLIPYRQMIQLLENAAEQLLCPDLGLRLAKRQYSEGILGPLDIAMRNSETVSDAWRYCADHVHTYSSGAHLSVVRESEAARTGIRFEIILPRVYRQRQAVEHALLLSHLATRMFSGERAQPEEVWFTHEPLEGGSAHGEYFGCRVRFGQPCNALFYAQSDFDVPVVGRDDRVLQLATYFIDAQFPSVDSLIRTRVRIAIEKQLAQGSCTQVEVAAALRMHPRTLQRRLRSEGENFEAMKDEVRRDAAVRYLRQTRLPLKTVAGLLGYSELSVLYRSCQRWFGESPSTVRHIENFSLIDAGAGELELRQSA
ncbi:AraC family transcriptional regulator [Novosphingobium sp. M1R2S20]|uniref:AraC family transcriptional regulator n=1 Tax=Novosphingobium rhizovicinum TaxID=3228928 RepID=A0ABV3R715_9SPHN